MIYLAVILLLTIFAGLWRVLHGPSRADRLVAVQLFGTTGTGLLLLLAEWQALPALHDAALVLALLAAVLSASLAQYLRGDRNE